MIVGVRCGCRVRQKFRDIWSIVSQSFSQSINQSRHKDRDSRKMKNRKQKQKIEKINISQK